MLFFRVPPFVILKMEGVQTMMVGETEMDQMIMEAEMVVMEEI